MKIQIFCLLIVLAALSSKAQHVYQIRADSVRIYNVCDTAELIIENRTRGVAGFLYNKGNGRTEFKKLKLETIGNNQIAITGQDTLDISRLPGIGGVDTIYRDGDYIKYTKRGVTHPIYLPEAYYEIPNGQAFEPAGFAANRVSGFGAYNNTDMPQVAGSREYFSGHVVWNGGYGYQMAVNWNGELTGPAGAFIRNKDNSQTTWGAWRELMFRDDADNTFAPKNHTHEGLYYTIAQLQAPGQSQVHWGNVMGAPSFSNYYTAGNLQTPGQSQVHWNNIVGAPNFTANETLQTITDRGNTTSQSITAADVLWTGRNSGSARALKIGYSGVEYGSIGYGLDFTTSSDVFNYSSATYGDNPTLLRFAQGFDFLTAATGTAGSQIPFVSLAKFNLNNANFSVPLMENGNRVWHAGNHGRGSGLNADLLDDYNTAIYGDASTVAVRDENGYMYANYYHTTAATESSTPTRIFGSHDNFIRPLDAGSVRTFLGIPGLGETLQSVTDRGNTTTSDIHFNAASGNPSNGLVWNYYTDGWKIFVESPKDTPSGNMVFESYDNSDEGWLFRNNGTSGGPGVSEVLSFNRDRFKYMENDVWHAGNLAFNTKGNNVALKTEPTGYLGLENWIRIGDGTGLYTPNERYLYNNSPASWAVRGNPGEVWIELQTYDATNRGGLYANSLNDVGIVNAAGNGWRLRTDVNGNAYVTGQVQATSFYQSSLRSLKKDIQPFTRSGLKILEKTQVRSFVFKADSTGKTNIGFIADEVPEEMSIPGKGGVDQVSTVALLVKSVQELNEQNKELAQKVKDLETIVSKLISENKK